MMTARDSMRVPSSVTNAELEEAVQKGSQTLRRVDALKEIIRRGGEGRAALLQRVVADRGTEAVLRVTAAHAMGRVAHAGNQEALMGALSDPDSYVVRRAAEALGRIGDRRALERLAQVPVPEVGPAGAAIRFAKVLASYRLAAGAFRLQKPEPGELLKLEAPVELKAVTAPAEVLKKAAAGFSRELPAIAVSSKSATQIECQGDELLLVMTEAAGRAFAVGDAAVKDMVAAVILKKSSEGVYALFEYVLAHVEGRELRLFGVRSTGVTAQYGKAVMEGESWRFELGALNTVYSPALEIHGRYSPKSGALELPRVVVNRGLVSGQKRPAVPRRVGYVVERQVEG